VTPDEVQVSIDLGGDTVVAGTAFFTHRRRSISTTFSYADEYLADGRAFDLSPDLTVVNARHHTAGLPGAFGDSAPDRWGRNLIKKRIEGQARARGERPAAITDVDYMMGVSDETRQGALRFSLRRGGPYLDDRHSVPKLLALPELMHAAAAVAAGEEDLSAVKALLDAGTGSLGGARPKASVTDAGKLFIAKFPHAEDEWDVMAWEKTTLDLAEIAGIRVPERSLVDIEGRGVLLLERFDRRGAGRVPYLSAMTLLRSADGDAARDYLELAEALAVSSSDAASDLAELWRRVVFGLAVHNTDDHLRNHGFLRQGSGWMLSPAFDMNPDPDTRSAHATGIAYTNGDDRKSSMAALLDTASEFGLSRDRAVGVARHVLTAVGSWQSVATSNGIAEREIRMFRDTFDAAHAIESVF
jgi:serine/threonine-protein kinase HipA